MTSIRTLDEGAPDARPARDLRYSIAYRKHTHSRTHLEEKATMPPNCTIVTKVLRARQPLAGVDLCSAGDVTHKLSTRQGGSAQGVGLRLRAVHFACVDMYIARLEA